MNNRSCKIDPLKYVDPSGWSFTNPDWYQNMFNGDMYYRSDLHGDEDAGKIEGEGWSYFGENGVFGEDELTLAAQYNLKSRKTEQTSEAFSLELSLKGAEAEGFMANMGYGFMPTQQVVYQEGMLGVALQAGQSYQYGSVITVTEKSSYFPENYGYSYSQGVGKEKLFGNQTNTNLQWNESVSRIKLNYTDNLLLRQPSFYTKKLVNGLSGGNNWDTRSKTYLKNWNEYNGGVMLLDKFIEKYDKK